MTQPLIKISPDADGRDRRLEETALFFLRVTHGSPKKRSVERLHAMLDGEIEKAMREREERRG